MHNFLRAVGFSDIVSRTDFDRLAKQIIGQCDEKQQYELNEKIMVAELRWKCNDTMGISLRGEYDQDGTFHIEHYFPYCISDTVSTNDVVMISKRVDTDAYTGMCDDYRLGVSLIFYLQNSIEYLKAKEKEGKITVPHSVSLSALSALTA